MRLQVILAFLCATVCSAVYAKGVRLRRDKESSESSEEGSSQERLYCVRHADGKVRLYKNLCSIPIEPNEKVKFLYLESCDDFRVRPQFVPKLNPITPEEETTCKPDPHSMPPEDELAGTVPSPTESPGIQPPTAWTTASWPPFRPPSTHSVPLTTKLPPTKAPSTNLPTSKATFIPSLSTQHEVTNPKSSQTPGNSTPITLPPVGLPGTHNVPLTTHQPPTELPSTKLSFSSTVVASATFEPLSTHTALLSTLHPLTEPPSQAPTINHKPTEPPTTTHQPPDFPTPPSSPRSYEPPGSQTPFTTTNPTASKSSFPKPPVEPPSAGPPSPEPRTSKAPRLTGAQTPSSPTPRSHFPPLQRFCIPKSQGRYTCQCPTDERPPVIEFEMPSILKRKMQF
ncbi:mucin-2-like isoform X2 [Acanthaster planci]|uniref:Mucin-2-like isoform X2 n=1 Tax=Acanthaster planci TaxID=133434 RepID=A0A8B7ZA70_ACAPL|nr:mucin-2-like isoform X2 [Acanthaster planci]